MPPSCHAAMRRIKEKTDLTVAIAGNPNVGKSCILNQLTGLNVITANYPGKTVELNFGVTQYGGLTIGIMDLPGTYGISAVSDDQWVARRGVLEGRPDVVIVVVDSSNLQRNLYLVLQFLELGFPVVVALNLIDYAAKIGLRTDYEKLSELLGVPVVPTIAICGEGIKELIGAAVDLAQGKLKVKPLQVSYGRDIESAIAELETAIKEQLPEIPYNLSPRALAIQLLESDPEFTGALTQGGKRRRLRRGWRWGAPPEVIEGLDEEKIESKILGLATSLAGQIEEKHGETASIRILRERHGVAADITSAVQSRITQPPLLSEKLSHYAVTPRTGIPIAVIVMLGVFAFIFSVGSFLSTNISNIWVTFVSPPLSGIIHSMLRNETIARIVVWGMDAGMLAWVTVGVPYVLTFYIALALLEDTGYLNKIAFLSDNVMHKLGLHGRALIPLLTGFGCNVPAIMGTRVLTTKRERLLASTLIVLTPCSARMAVILGAVALFVGWQYAVLIYLFELVLILLVGFSLNKVLPGEPSGLVMEMFPFRAPLVSEVLKKTWYRFKEFIYIAAPLIITGSLILGVLYETKYIWMIVDPMSPITTSWLGLPALVGIPLIFGVFRKELTLELLIALAVMQYGVGAKNLLLFMSPLQIFIFALVITIYIPCVATISVLGKEVGWKNTLLIMAFTITLAIFIGGVAYRLISFFT